MQLEVGAILEGKVTGITKFGAFVELPGGKTGMVHISEVAPTYVKEIRDHVSENQVVKVKILSISEEGKISLSMKKALPPPPPAQGRRGRPARSPGRPGGFEWQSSKSEPASFEDMMSRFKQSSDEKMSDLKRSMDSKRGSFSRRGSGFTK
ncbi:MAG: S1 RNA-binding domain-containing protein [Clostridiales bacterium]|nr:S1 RNA-binding domain-containing protein [Clostridiales bacterium]